MSRSFSDINSYLRCPKQFWYRNARRLQRVRKDATLHQGSVGHHLLMGGFLAMQRGEDVQTGIDEGYEYLISEIRERWASMPAEAEPEYQMVGEMTQIIERYFAWADWTGWEILHVEEEFWIKVDGREVTFTPDLVARDPFGKVWIIDHKTTSSIDEGVPFASQQSLLYLAGVRLHYPEAVGFLFNFIRKKLPTQPRLNKTKNKDDGLYHVNDLNRIDTEFEILYEFLQTEAPELLDHPKHRQRLADLRDNGKKFFDTQRVLANEKALDQIMEEISWTLEDIDRSEDYGRWPRVLREDNGYTSCGKCEFESLCAAELLDWNVEVVLRDYEPRDPKNPYETEDL